MGLFGPNPEPTNMALAAKLRASAKGEKKAKKVLAENEAAIAAALRPQEEVEVEALSFGWQLIVVTNQRTVSFGKGKAQWELAHPEVHHTELNALLSDSINVFIISKKSVDNYLPDDRRYFKDSQNVNADSPGVGRALCAAIDQYI